MPKKQEERIVIGNWRIKECIVCGHHFNSQTVRKCPMCEMKAERDLSADELMNKKGPVDK